MILAEKLYRKLLWLYPAEHRRVYGQLMVQHARDLSRTAQGRGRLEQAGLYFRLLKDGLINALIEQGEGVMAMKKSYQPVPWLSVLLVALPGLLMALDRWNMEPMDSLIPILGRGYILLMAIGLPIAWWRKRQFPVWGLLFAGMLTWFLTYMVGMTLSEQSWIPAVFGYGRGIVLLNIILAIILILVLSRGRRLPNKFWAILGIMVLVNILAAVIYGIISSGGFSRYGDLQRFFMISLNGPAEGLMLVAVGLLAARQYGVLAILFVVGGYLYMFMDSDYFSGYAMRDWSGLSTYLFSVSFVFLVMTPVALLRARTRLGQATALFVPTILFIVARLVVPLLVLEQTARLMPGDIMISINVLLALILAWVLYGAIGKSAEVDQLSSMEEWLARPDAAR